MSEHLLPANATALEIAIAQTIDTAHLHAPAEAIRTVKWAPTDGVLPYLIWEYGLEELLPYLPEPRRAIREGVIWQRLRGTPQALAVALSWIGAGAVVVEQEEPGGAHWAEFQFDPGRVLADAEVDRYIAVARLSAPARSRLSRIYHGHDLRRVVLDTSRLGDALLSDYSGSVWTDGQTRLSFGRRWLESADASSLLLASQIERLRAHTVAARYRDRCLLDEMAIGCVPLPNPKIEAATLYEKVLALSLVGQAITRPERRFARAQIVLSEQWRLADTNACTPPRVWIAADETFRLGDALSSGIGRGHWEAITERLEREAQSAIVAPAAALVASRDRLARQGLFANRHLRLDDLMLSAETIGWMRLGRAAWHGDVAKRQTRPVGMTPLRRFAKSEIVLSDAAPLGETDARTARGAWREIAVPWQLDAIRLSDRGWIERWPLDALDERAHTRQGDLPVAPIAHRSACQAHSRTGLAALPAATRSGARLSTHAAAWRGQRWAGRWQAKSWAQARECVVTQRSREVMG